MNNHHHLVYHHKHALEAEVGIARNTVNGLAEAQDQSHYFRDM